MDNFIIQKTNAFLSTHMTKIQPTAQCAHIEINVIVKVLNFDRTETVLTGVDKSKALSVKVIAVYLLMDKMTRLLSKFSF